MYNQIARRIRLEDALRYESIQEGSRLYPRENRLATAGEQEVLAGLLRGNLLHALARIRESVNGLDPQPVFLWRT